MNGEFMGIDGDLVVIDGDLVGSDINLGLKFLAFCWLKECREVSYDRNL